jgi:hypothetical protein
MQCIQAGYKAVKGFDLGAFKVAKKVSKEKKKKNVDARRPKEPVNMIDRILHSDIPLVLLQI